MIKKTEAYFENERKIWFDISGESFLFEGYEINNEKKQCDVYFYNKKKLLSHRVMECRNITMEAELLLKSYMVIFLSNSEGKRAIVKELNKFCADQNCYGPIVNMDTNEIIYFPRLGYEDGFLLKSILECKFGDRDFNVSYGKVIV